MSRHPSQSDSVVTTKNIFHVAMLAFAMTGLFMAFSAEDLGSAGPVIISLGISLVFYALIAEALLGLLSSSRSWRRVFLPRSPPKKLSDMMAIRSLVFVAACTATWANAFCAEAAQRYGVDERLLMAIAKQESDFQPQAKHTNENGSVDVGLMQINSQHFKTLNRFNITEQSLLDPCVNVHVGAWILARAIKEHGPTWRAVGAYNAGSKPEREADRLNYATKVFKHLERFTTKRPSLATETQAVYSMQVIE